LGDDREERLINEREVKEDTRIWSEGDETRSDQNMIDKDYRNENKGINI